MPRKPRVVKPLSERKVFSTGQVAALCHVSPRTASKWIDSGRLPGYRIPGSTDRRVTRDALVAFLTLHGMPLGELATPPEAVPT